MLPFFQWCYGTWIGETIRESTWLFPLIEAFHLVGLGLTAGTVLTVDLRLLGVGLSRQSAAQLWASVRPWFLGSVCLSEAIKCYYSFAFWIKMASLLLALVFAFTIRRHVVQAGPTSGSWREGRLTALASLVLWFGVAWGGRWIGFS
jgi:Family of unknown function (DUF6644)